MMGSDDILPVTITLVLEGETLLASLTDSRTVACFARLETPALSLQAIREATSALLRERSGDAPAGPPQAHSLGSAIHLGLLPERIRQALRQCACRVLNLQLSDNLLWVPWELAYDGDEVLGAKYPVARQVVLGEVPPERIPVRARPVLEVLLLCDAAEPAGYPVSLQRRLHVMEGLRVERIDAGQLQADVLLQRVAGSDVVHYVGPPRQDAEIATNAMPGGARPSISLREIAASASSALLIAEWAGVRDVTEFDAAERELAASACRNGLTLLMRPLPAGGEADAAVVSHVYAGLVEGLPLGEAVLRARRLRGSETPVDPSHAPISLYGNASLVLASRDERLGQDHRRQVTVLCYDLVGSTRLMRVLGEEEYSLLLKRYHERCRDIVGAYAGVSEPPQGDGIMCFFGLPVAREDCAAQALRAALRIVQEAADWGVEVRVGVATGEVVIRAGHPVGIPMHLAARIQAAAATLSVLVSEETRRIVRSRFVFEELDRVALKDFDKPRPVFRLVREITGADAEQTDRGAWRIPLIGRDRELRLIENHWAAACAGRLRKIVISGEAGMGKSRLMREFKQSIGRNQERVFELRGAADLASSAYYPLIDLLRRLLGIENSGDSEGNLTRIESMLPAERRSDGSVQLLATLLSVPYEARYAPPALSAEKARRSTVVLLVECLRRQAAMGPVCLLVEDVQWLDPSSREVLKQLNDHGKRLPLLMLFTERRDGRRRYRLGFRAYELRLKRLSRDAARTMIMQACGEGSLPSGIVRSIVEKSDGVPLFIEESTRLTIEREALSGASDRLAGWSVPSTINDLLTERLDRVGAAKWVAGLGAVIGREFSFALLHAALEERDAGTRCDLETSLHALVRSGLIIRKGSEKHETFYFKHALVRDAAYQSLLQSDRIALHRTIADLMEHRFRHLAERQPELLAHHYTAAGMAREALDGWERAARLAASRSALNEAIDHLTSALAVTARLPADPAREQTELRLQLLLAGQLIATEGYGAQRVEAAYARAADLCRSAGDDSALLKTQLGLEGYHFMRADFAKAHEIADQAAALAQRSGDPMRELQSQWAVANLCFHQGELASAVSQMDLCLDKYRRLGTRRSVIQDPGVMCLCYSAWGKWQLGYPDQALQRARRVVLLAEKANHKFSMAEAYGFGASVHHFRGENREALKYADRAIEICEESGFSVWLAHARLMRGRALAEQGDADRGIAEMKEAYGLWAATGAIVTVPFHMALRAEGLALAGRPAEGLALLQAAYDVIDRYGERYYEAEVMRLMGELLLQVKRDNSGWDEAERWMRRAMDGARQRQLRGLTLRSAISLARLMVVQGRFSDAIGILKPEYEWFTEGLRTRDLRAAQELLEALISPRIPA